MTQISNRFFNGIALNTGNTRSYFEYFGIVTVKETNDYEGGVIFEEVKNGEDYLIRDNMIGEPFYSIYGAFKADHAQSIMSITTVENLDEAIRLIETLSGNSVQEQQS